MVKITLTLREDSIPYSDGLLKLVQNTIINQYGQDAKYYPSK